MLDYTVYIWYAIHLNLLHLNRRIHCSPEMCQTTMNTIDTNLSQYLYQKSSIDPAHWVHFIGRCRHRYSERERESEEWDSLKKL